MHVDFSLEHFPQSGLVKDRCGLPFSCVVQPFSKLESSDEQLAPADEIARCSKCYSYINSYCVFASSGWSCSVCGTHMEFKPYTSIRYNTKAGQRESLPELASNIFEALVEDPTPVDASAEGVTGPAPVYIAMVDVSGGEDFLELVRSALLASLEALPAGAQFGLITFSNKIGLHDVRSATPCARYIPVFESGPLLLPLAELMPLTALLATVGSHKEAIATALESLAAEQGQDPGSQAAANGVPVTDMMQRAAPQAKRGLGPALLAILDYLKAVKSAPFSVVPSSGSRGATMHDQLPPAQSPVRLMMFLSGMPDLGPGKLINLRRRHQQMQKATQQGGSAGTAAASAAVPHGSEAGATAQMMGALGLQQREDGDWLQDVGPQTRAFYEQAAVAAASLGICVDMYAICPSAVGLPVLEPISNSTGGAMYLYPSTEESALPQDMYRRLNGLHASSGLLRLRTTPVLRPVRFYGRLYPDPSIPNLHHIIAADCADTFAVDFDFDKGASFPNPGHGLLPTVQVAFQYTVVVPMASEPVDAVSEGKQGAVYRLSLQRRLRVATIRVQVAKDPMDVYQHVNCEAVVAVLMQKIMRAARSKGPSAARLLLRDWLVILASNYHRIANRAITKREEVLATPVDLTFAAAKPLERLPRLVYALLRSPLLAPPVDGQHPDLNTFLEHLWSCLPPQELVIAVYPSLSSWSDPDHQVSIRHSLSRAALSEMITATGGRASAPIFLLDAYIMVIVYYSSDCPKSIQYPPPQQSALRSAIGAIRHERKITPLVRIVREGSEDAELFHQLLLDEPEEQPTTPGNFSNGSDIANPGQSSLFGLEQFLTHILHEIGVQLKSELQPTT